MFWLNFSGSDFLEAFAHSVSILLRRRSEYKHRTSEQECENKKQLAQVKANILAFFLVVVSLSERASSFRPFVIVMITDKNVPQ